jgi:hypothetical protein
VHALVRKNDFAETSAVRIPERSAEQADTVQ